VHILEQKGAAQLSFSNRIKETFEILMLLLKQEER